MTKEERKIREDILNELEIPNVLDKVKPYANEKAAILQEDRKTVHLNFRRPAKIFVTCLACFFGVMIVFIIGISINGGYVNFGSARKDAAENAFFDGVPHQSNSQSEPSAPSYDDEKSTEYITTDEEFLNYCKQEHIGPQNEVTLSEYFNDIKGYVSDGKSVEEIISIFNEQDEGSYEEFVRITYDYLTK